MPLIRTVSVVVPTRDEAGRIGSLVRAILAQRTSEYAVEVIVADDGSRDGTTLEAAAAGARVSTLPKDAAGDNPAAARNRGARAAKGDPLVFLDADCVPDAAWLATLIAAFDRGESIVGGALDLPGGLPWSARCDYYGGWYHVHSRRPAGYVPNHPPGNLGVRRGAFESTSGFNERQPIAYAHEELRWQAELARCGKRICFEPDAIVRHHNRAGLGNMLRRNYRWGFSALPSKAEAGAVRFARLYAYPRLMILAAAPLAIASAVYILGCWLRARRFEVLAMFPAILAARCAYAAGMGVGGLRWLRGGFAPGRELRPRWE